MNGFTNDFNYERFTMKIKASELDGAALDWAVAKCEGEEFLVLDGKVFIPDWEGIDEPYHYRPSVSYNDGGTIIERERMQLWVGQNWNASMDSNNINSDKFESGPTLLIAAMRCYVASQFGDEVEVPDCLMEANNE